MKKRITPLAIAAALIFTAQTTFAQNVGINTTQPDPSAALEIAGTDKGLLVPRVSLQSLTDNTTIPNPATALLVYNTNAGVGKIGFYYNSGTAASPAWSPLGVGSLTLPYDKTAAHAGALFGIENTDPTTNSSAITGYSVGAIGLRGISQTGRAVVGQTLTSGIGVSATASNTNGTALEVSGPMRIKGPGQSVGAGKVLTSDANGNASWEGGVAFKANGVLGGGSENIAAGIKQKVVFANEIYDTGLNYNDANSNPNSTFTAPTNGIYHFDLKIGWSKPNSVPVYTVRTFLVRTRNGSSAIIAHDYLKSEYGASSRISTEVDLIVGDMIHIEVENLSSDGMQLATLPELTYFNGRLVVKQD